MSDYDRVCRQYDLTVSEQTPAGRPDPQYVVTFRPRPPAPEEDCGGEIVVQVVSGFLRVTTSSFRTPSPLSAHRPGAAREAVRRHRSARQR